MSLDGIKKLGLIAGLLCLSYSAQAQIVTQGRIVYERKTNLKKLFKGNKRVEMFLDKDVTWRIEEFEMFFNDSLSAFTPIESDEPEQGFMKYLTSHNQIYKNLNSNERLAVMACGVQKRTCSIKWKRKRGRSQIVRVNLLDTNARVPFGSKMIQHEFMLGSLPSWFRPQDQKVSVDYQGQFSV